MRTEDVVAGAMGFNLQKRSGSTAFFKHKSSADVTGLIDLVLPLTTSSEAFADKKATLVSQLDTACKTYHKEFPTMHPKTGIIKTHIATQYAHGVVTIYKTTYRAAARCLAYIKGIKPEKADALEHMRAALRIFFCCSNTTRDTYRPEGEDVPWEKMKRLVKAHISAGLKEEHEEKREEEHEVEEAATQTPKATPKGPTSVTNTDVVRVIGNRSTRGEDTGNATELTPTTYKAAHP